MAQHLSPWPEQRPQRSEAERAQFAREQSAHLPVPEGDGTLVSDDDLAAMKAAHAKRFNEQTPRTETLMAVANIGYRMALRDAPEVSTERDRLRVTLATVARNLEGEPGEKASAIRIYINEQLTR